VCYVFGDSSAAAGEERRPQLAIEVVWTAGRIDTLDIYRKLGVAEVWYWRRGRIQPYALRGERYLPVDRSEVLPGLELELLTAYIESPTTFDAIRGYRQAPGERLSQRSNRCRRFANDEDRRQVGVYSSPPTPGSGGGRRGCRRQGCRPRASRGGSATSPGGRYPIPQ
jgi:hypothetical protein